MWTPPGSNDLPGSGGWDDGSGPPGVPPSFPGSGPPAAPNDPLISPDYAGWFQRSTAIINAAWRPLLILQLCGLVITLPVLAFVSVQSAFDARDLDRKLEQGLSETPDLGNLVALGGISLAAGVVSYALYALVLLASVRVVVTVATGGQASVKRAASESLGRVLPFIGWELLTALLAMVAVCACFFPVLYVLAATAVLAAVVTFERDGILGRCFRLFNGDLGSSLARVLTIAAVWVVVSVVTGVPGFVLQPGADTSTGLLVAMAIVGALIQVAAQVVIGVITAPMIVTTYADMRARVEHLSTPMLVDELSVR
jgi:hypothetical protein